VAPLSYLDNKELYEKFDKTRPWNAAANFALLDQMPGVFLHPAARGEKTRQATCFQLLTGRARRSTGPGL
jgi:hypothetical protein